ncbi:MAG: hypothetical protein ACR2NP_01280 [Pirellulaceae bacterium]
MEQDLATSKYLEALRADEDTNEKLQTLNSTGKTGGWTNFLTTICVLLVLGSVIGCLSAAYGFYKLSEDPMAAVKENRSTNHKVKEWIKGQAETKERWMPVLIYLELAKLILSGAFAFAAAMLIIRHEKARQFTIAVCGLTLFYHLSVLGMSFVFLGETGGLVNSALDDMFAQVQFDSKKDKELAENYVKNSLISWVTVAVSIAFLFKLAFYGTIMAYLWGDDVKKVFGEDPLEYLRKQEQEADDDMERARKTEPAWAQLRGGQGTST